MLIVGFTILCVLCFHFSSLQPPPPPPPPCHVPVTKPREICTKCSEGLVSNILQGDKMLHFAYLIFILIPLN
jgi:hypothetical protein